MSFTWFDKFTKACSRLDRDDQKELICALVIYGMYEEEVELPYMLDALFEGFKEDIDNSKKSHKSGSRGGRPKASEQVERVSETSKGGVSENAKRGVSETSKGGVSENAKPKPNQTKINQTKPNQETESARARVGAQAGNDDARFIADALDIFNAETGLDVRDLTPEAMLGLQRIRGSGRTLEDVRSVVRAKRDQWSGNSRMRSYLRPSTLFGERFEEYFAETKKAVSAYAEYD